MMTTHGPWLYYLDWALYPTAILLIAMFTLDTWAWLAWCAAGFVLWTFVEYWTHRSLLHRWFWQGNHEAHHKQPQAYVVFPLWYLPSIFLAVLAVFWLVLPTAIAWPLYAGFLLGYCWFLTMHHWLHHIDLKRRGGWLQRYAIWHNRHHKMINCNYGITTPTWDWLFRTSF